MNIFNTEKLKKCLTILFLKRIKVLLTICQSDFGWGSKQSQNTTASL